MSHNILSCNPSTCVCCAVTAGGSAYIVMDSSNGELFNFMYDSMPLGYHSTGTVTAQQLLSGTHQGWARAGPACLRPSSTLQHTPAFNMLHADRL
jgi:hypothetical protein